MKMDRNNKLQLFAFAMPLLFVLMAFAFSAPAPSYWHESDHYSVELDGEGDAFVLATLNLESISENNLSKVFVEVPYENVQVYKAAQGYYGGGEFLDFESTKLSESTLLAIELKSSLQKGQRTTIALVYQVPSVAKPELRGYSFSFSTIKDKSALIRSVGVNVAVPENMLLKGKGEADVKYKPSAILESMSSAKPMLDVMPGYGYTPPAMHSAKNVDPGESFAVTGLYGKSRALLYLPEIAASLFGLLLLVLFAKAFSIGEKLRDLFSAGAPRAEFSGHGFSFVRALFLGAVSSVSFTLVYFLAEYLSPSIRGDGAIEVLFFLLIWLLILLSFAVPAYYGFRSSWREGLAVFVVALALSIGLLIFLGGIEQTDYRLQGQTMMVESVQERAQQP